MYNQNFTSTGLTTNTFSIPTAGPYSIRGKTTLPTNTDDGNTGTSACVTTINQNGSPIYTGLPGAEGFYTTFLAAAGDVMTVVFSSGATIDQPLNTIKCSFGVSSGQ